MEPQEYEGLLAQLTALEAKLTQQAQLDAWHAKMAAQRPLVPPSPLHVRRERAALWRIALLCKSLLRAQVLAPVTRAYVLDMARECRDVLQQADGDREDHGRTGV